MEERQETTEQTPPRRRLEALSLCNLAFCAMVLLLHLCSDTILAAPKDTVFYVLVYSAWKLCAVAVYGFLFLGGLKACLGRRRPLGDYYRRRAKTILLPYLVWSVIYYLLRLPLGHETFSLLRLGESLLLGSAAAHLYYVVAIVQFYALIPLWRRMVDRLSPAVVLPVLASLASLLPMVMTWLWQTWLPTTPVYLDRVFLSYLFVWCAGCYAGANYERFTQALLQARWLLWIAALGLLPLYLYCCYQTDVHLQWYGFLAALQQYYYLIATGAIVALALARPRLMRFRVLQALDRASYQIYLGHMMPLIAAPGLIRALGVPDLAALHLLARAVIVLVPTLGLSLLWQWGRARRAKSQSQ